MKRITLLLIGFLMTQSSQAVIISYIEGDIYAESKTIYNGTQNAFQSALGFDSSGPVVVDRSTNEGSYAHSSGAKFNGSGTSDQIRFDLTATAQVFNTTGQPTAAIATVRSGENPNDMIKFRFDPSDGESLGQDVEVSMESSLNGILNNFGPFGGGFTTTDFVLSIYRANDLDNPVINFDTFQYSTGSNSLPGSLTNTQLEDSLFKIGDEFFVYFSQIAYAEANVAGYLASAFATQSSSDIYSETVTITASAVSVIPEPSTIMLFGLGFAGIGFLFAKQHKYQ